MEYRRPQSYEERFLAVSTKLERLFYRLAIVGFIGIVLSQLVLSLPRFRQVFSVDRMEGQKISEYDDRSTSVKITTKELIIRPVKGQAETADAWVKIDGIPVVKVGQSEVIVKVKQNNKLEIDTSSQNGIFRFEIDHNDPSITSPTPGTLIESSENHAAVIERILISQ